MLQNAECTLDKTAAQFRNNQSNEKFKQSSNLREQMRNLLSGKGFDQLKHSKTNFGLIGAGNTGSSSESIPQLSDQIIRSA